MIKAKNLSIVLSVIMLICLISSLSCCTDEKTNDEKYDVAVMIVRKDVKQDEPTEERWIVPFDKNYIDIEQAYDGKEYTYYVYAYSFPEHPDFAEIWFLYDGFYLAKFTCTQFEQKVPSEFNSVRLYESICEKGNYTMSIYATKNSQLWKPKHIELHITIN